MALPLPLTFGRYELTDRLAAGGMAELFKARAVGAHGFAKPVVIKKILPHLAADARFVKMFIDEAKITARLQHPKIAQVLDLGTIGDELFIAMEFVDGIDALGALRDCARRKRKLAARLAIHIAHEILDALEYAHEATDDDGRPLGIVHRDVSPANVLLSRRGDVKLTDFGVARVVERQNQTQAGTLKGKYGYMSPQQIEGKPIDRRADVFSAGVVLAEMLMNRRLFVAASDLDVLIMVRDARLDRFHKYGASIPGPLRAIVEKSLTRDPDERFQSAGEFRDALAELLYSQYERVTPRDLGDFVARAAEAKAQPRVDEAPADEGDDGTLTGPETRAQRLRADEAARIARDVLFSGRGRAMPLADTRPAAPPAPPQVALEEPDDDIPIDLDLRAPVDDAIDLDLEADIDIVEASMRADAVLAKQGPRAHKDSNPLFADFGAVDPLAGVPLGSEDLSSHFDSPADVSAADSVELGEGDRDSLELGGLEGMMHELDGRADAGGLDEPFELPALPAEPDPPLSGRDAGGAPHELGDLADVSPIALIARLATERASCLIVAQISAITKEIWLVDGIPQFVASNVASERLGEFLVASNVISSGELAMALAVLPNFDNKLGDTLVGLGLMKPLDVFRQLGRQVRAKLIDVCTWQKGLYEVYRGESPPRWAAQLHLDPFEIVASGAARIAAQFVQRWFERHSTQVLEPVAHPPIALDHFRAGMLPKEVYRALGRSQTLAHLAESVADEADRLAFLRTAYLLTECRIAEFK